MKQIFYFQTFLTCLVINKQENNKSNLMHSSPLIKKPDGTITLTKENIWSIVFSGFIENNFISLYEKKKRSPKEQGQKVQMNMLEIIVVLSPRRLSCWAMFNIQLVVCFLLALLISVSQESIVMVKAIYFYFSQSTGLFL